MSFPVVILAAGKSQRMGFPKLLMAERGVPVLRIMSDRLVETGWGSFTVIISQSEMQSFVTDNTPESTAIIYNHQPERGMISSLRLGIDSLEQNCSGFLAWQVDHPLIDPKTLVEIQGKAIAERVVIPTYNGRRGHPTWWGRAAWDALKSHVADGGARAVLRLPEITIKELPVDDVGILANINIPEDATRYGLARYEVEKTS